MHRQADDVPRQRLAHRQAAVRNREMPVSGLLVHRLRIIDRGRHAVRFQRGGEPVAVAVRQADGVLRPYRRIAGRDTGNGDDIAEIARIALGHRVARGDLVVEDLQLLDQDGRLHGVEPAGQAEADVVVLVRALPMHANAAQGVGEIGVIGEDGAAVAVAAERLRREEAGRGDDAEAAEPPAPVGGAEGLGRVVQNEQSLGLGHRPDRIVVGALPEQVDGDDALRLEAEPLGGRDAAPERGQVDVEGSRIHVHEQRRRAGQCHALASGAEGEGRAQHRVARADALGHQHHQQRVGAARAGDDVLRAAERGKARFKLRHLGTVDELAMGENPAHGLVDGWAQAAALGADIDEGHGVGTVMLVHEPSQKPCTDAQTIGRSSGAPPRGNLNSPRAGSSGDRRRSAARGTASRSRGWRRPPRR